MIVAELKDLKNIPVTFTLGSFDGLHRGHFILLNRLKSESASNGSKSLVISFYPHPRHVVDSDFDLKLLNDKNEKIQILKDNGLDYIHFINFTPEFAKTGFQDFYKNYIFKNLSVKGIIAGTNHGFGSKRSGNSMLLSEICSQNRIDLISVEPILFEGKPISSTRIRNSISSGHIVEANSMLGYNYSITGFVEKGKGIGKKISFPTANIPLGESVKVIPAKGVYFSEIKIGHRTFTGMSNIGINPTFDGTGLLTLECNIFGFNEDIYGKEITVSFVEKIRDEFRFSGLEELKSAIQRDFDKAKLLEIEYRDSE